MSSSAGLNSKLWDELLKEEIFYSMKELPVLAESWRVHYNTVRPHSLLGYRPPAPRAWLTEASQAHGKVESKERFPLFHVPNSCDESYPYSSCYTNNLLVQKIEYASQPV
jgi:hypothetical protein